MSTILVPALVTATFLRAFDVSTDCCRMDRSRVVGLIDKMPFFDRPSFAHPPIVVHGALEYRDRSGTMVWKVW